MRAIALCLLLLLPDATASDSPKAAADTTLLQQNLDAYLTEMADLKTHITVTRVARLSSGRISEKTYKVQCLIRDHIIRVAQYGHGNVEGERSWFDVRQSLIFPDGRTAEWRHPGFPGQLSFGKDSSDAARIRFTAWEYGDPFYPVKKIRRVASKGRMKITAETTDNIVTRSKLGAEQELQSAGLQADYIEIVFSKEFDLLPVSMTRICQTQHPGRDYDSGASITVDYLRSPGGTIVPHKAHRDTRLRDDVQGPLAMTWEFAPFNFSKPSEDEMRLQVPAPALAVESDSGRQYSLNEPHAAAAVREQFGQFVTILPAPQAKRLVAHSFIGQCPDLPVEYQQIRQQVPPKSAAAGTSALMRNLVALHGLGLLLAGTVTIFRRKRAPDGSR